MDRTAGCGAQRVRTGGLRCRARWVVAAVLLILLASVVPAFAHASLVSASPAPGAGLPQAPAAVVLRFDEALNLRLSHVDVDDARGREVGVGATRPVAGDGLAMQRRLGALTPGVYTVRWTSVALDDGHVLHGSYRFGIGTAPTGAGSVAAGPTATEGWAGLVGRWAGLLGLLSWTGTALLARRAQEAGVPAARIGAVAVTGPVMALAGLFGAAVSAAEIATGRMGAVGTLLTAGASGRWRLAGLVLPAVGVAVGAGWRAGRLRVLRWSAVGVGAGGLFAEAASGHAGVAAHPVPATLVLFVHLLAVAVWVAAIMLGVLAGRRAIAVLAALTPAAVMAAVAVAATGVGNAAQQLSDWGQLTGTGYGRAVLGKAAALAVMTVAGLSHYWLRRRRVPRPRGVRVAVRAELVAAVTAVAVASALVGYPDPPRAATVAAEQAAGRPPLAALAGRPAAAVAAGAGPYVLGWSLSPPRPGRVRVELTVVGAQPGDGLRDATFTAHRTDGTTSVRTGLRPCGFGCFTGTATVTSAGRWTTAVSVRGNRGPATATRSLPLPAPDGRADFARMLTAMGRLHSLRMDETLRGSTTGPAVLTHYRFAAPDAMAYSIAGGGSAVLIGPDSYHRDGPAAHWQHDRGGFPFGWPTAFYRSEFQPAAAIRVLRADSEVVELSFVRSDITAWFTLDLDPHTFVLRAMHMRAEGHLMDDTVTATDQPISIRPPTGSGRRATAMHPRTGMHGARKLPPAGRMLYGQRPRRPAAVRGSGRDGRWLRGAEASPARLMSGLSVS
ncbi:copper resistance CopC/CopD family protein [Streptomyces sp. NPDC056230]|uniref:copper resistance CopC/CopD family protein n=1 Tax=Streptomyces sp. NPDC056230 TaxID=3345754 RepID=UPI0035DA4E9C